MKRLFSLIVLSFFPLTGCAPEEEAMALTVLPEVEGANHYEDEYLSFDYPKEVDIYLKRALDETDLHTLEFVYWDEKIGAHASTGIVLTYPHLTTAEEKTVDELRIEYANKRYPQTDNYILDGRKALKVTSRDQNGYSYTLYIPGEDTQTATYQIHASFFQNDLSEAILDAFVQSAEFAQ